MPLCLQPRLSHSTFCTVAPYTPCLTGQPSVWQIHQYTAQDVSFNLTSTFSSITIGAADTKSFTPLGTPGITAYSVSASKPGSSPDFIFNTTPINTDWSNQNETNPITDQAVQAPLTIDVNNSSDPKTLVISLNTNISEVGTQPLLSVLNLDNFLLSYTELTLCYAATETALCCGNSISVTVFVLEDVANLASVTGDLYTDNTFQTKAADGYYSDDTGISCSTPPGGTNMRVSECSGGVNWTMENTNGNIFGEIIQYQQGVPGSGDIWCGTVQEVDLSTTPDATVYGFITRECGDTVHCHE